MARLVTSGAEFQAATTVLNQAEGQGYICTGPPTIETTVVRSGGAAWKSTGSTQHTRWDTVTSDGNDYFIRAYFRWPAAPSVAQRIITANPGAQGYVQTLAGTTQVALYDDANVQVGSASAALPTGDFENRIEMVIGITSGRLKLYVNGALIAGLDSGADLGATITSFTIGNNSTSTDTLYWDDVAINDSTGGVDDGLPGPGKIILKPAASDFQRDASWLNSAEGTTNLFADVDNTPPTATFGTPAGFVHNDASTTTETYTAETTTYSAGGIAATDRIKVVQAVATIGDGVAAATRSIGLKLDSNPSDTEVTATTPNAAVSTYPTGWITMRGTLDSSPSVTLTDPIRVRVRKNSANADVLAVALLGAYVEYNPVVNIDADAAAITVAGLAPGFTITQAPGATDISVTGQAPGQTLSVTPPVQDIAVTGQAPGFSVSVAPPVADISVQGQTPSASISDTEDVTVADIAVTGQVPGVGITSEPSAGAVTVAGEAPGVEVSVVVSTAQIAVEGLVPTLGGDAAVSADTGVITVEGLAPTVSVSGTAPVDTGGGWVQTRRRVLRRDAEVFADAALVWARGLPPTVSVFTPVHAEVEPDVGLVWVQGLPPVPSVLISAEPGEPSVDTEAEDLEILLLA